MNDVLSMIVCLIDMGIEFFMILLLLLCVCVQCFMCCVCKICKVEINLLNCEKEIFEKVFGWSGKIYKVNLQGCLKCGSFGYKGCFGIYELMIINEEFIDGINKEMEFVELKKIVMCYGMKILYQDSMFKVKEGFIMMEEVIVMVFFDF